MEDVKYCESCGMPMQFLEDFGGKKMDNPYCVHCTDSQGVLKPYDVVFENIKEFAIHTMGIVESEAIKIAQEGMSKMPAWQNKA